MAHFIGSKLVQLFWQQGYEIDTFIRLFEINTSSMLLLLFSRGMVEHTFLLLQLIHVLEMAMQWLHVLEYHFRFVCLFQANNDDLSSWVFFLFPLLNLAAGFGVCSISPNGYIWCWVPHYRRYFLKKTYCRHAENYLMPKLINFISSIIL